MKVEVLDGFMKDGTTWFFLKNEFIGTNEKTKKASKISGNCIKSVKKIEEIKKGLLSKEIYFEVEFTNDEKVTIKSDEANYKKFYENHFKSTKMPFERVDVQQSAAANIAFAIGFGLLALFLFKSCSTDEAEEPASALSSIITPQSACSIMDSKGMATSGWHQLNDGVSDGTFICSSNYLELGTGINGGLPNNIAYYVNGASNGIHNIKLVLNINNKKQAKLAKNKFLDNGAFLVKSIMGTEFPEQIRLAILDGKATTFSTGTHSISTLREDWPTGKGYEIHLIIK